MVLRASTGISSGGGGSGTVTQVNTGTGLTGGPITTTGTVSLANTAVTAGIYGDATTVAQITVDAQGRITAAANVAISGGGGGSGTVNSGTSGQIAYYATTGTAVSGLTTGTGVTTALGINTGSAGAFVVNGGALGTPSSGTLTNATGLPLTTGVTGLLPIANGGLAASVSPTTAGNTIFTTDGTSWSSTQKIVQSTAVATTSGTSVDFTSIPSWVKRITVMVGGVSLSGTSDILIQLGTSGGITSTGYISNSTAVDSTGAGNSTSTSGFVMRLAANASTCYGAMTICLINTNQFVASHSARQTTLASMMGGGLVALSGVLTRVRFTSVNGTDTFDAGSVNILYE